MIIGAKVLFSETQRFRQWWVWVLVVGVGVLSWWGFVEQIMLKERFGDSLATNWWLMLSCPIFGVGLPLLVAFCRMRTLVTDAGITLRFFPLLPWPFFFAHDRIRKFAAVRYNGFLEYGGWGTSFGPGGWSLNVSGNEGVQLSLTDGRRFLIGSQRADELAAALEQGRALAKGGG